MAKNGIITPYDDAGFPAVAATAVSVPYTGGAVKTSAGRLLKIVVTTALAGAGGVLTFWDNPSAAAGTILAAIPTAAGTIGATFTVDLPAVNGIWVSNPSSTLTGGAVTVGYA